MAVLDEMISPEDEPPRLGARGRKAADIALQAKEKGSVMINLKDLTCHAAIRGPLGNP